MSCVHESWCGVSGVCCPPARRPPRDQQNEKKTNVHSQKKLVVCTCPLRVRRRCGIFLSLKKTIHLSTKKQEQ